MKRSAPSGGYDFGPKRNYRKAVWGALRDIVVKTKPVKDAHVALMPSIEGREIEVVEAFGFRRENMHVIDKNPAIVAHLTRRYPGINTYGVDLGLAASRMVRDGVVLDAANLDLCGPANDALMLTLFSMSVLFPRYHGAMAVTWLRGREGRASSRWWRALMDEDAATTTVDRVFGHMRRANIGTRALRRTDAARVCASFFYAAQVRSVTVTRCSAYKSTAGNQTMLWTVAELGMSQRFAEAAASLCLDLLGETTKLMRAAAKPSLAEYKERRARVCALLPRVNQEIAKLEEARRGGFEVPVDGDMETKLTELYRVHLDLVAKSPGLYEEACNSVNAAIDARKKGKFYPRIKMGDSMIAASARPRHGSGTLFGTPRHEVTA